MQNGKKGRDGRDGRDSLLALLFILGGMLLASYPFISNFINEQMAGAEILVYQDEVNSLQKEETEAYLAEAREYNRLLTETNLVLVDPFSENYNTFRLFPYQTVLQYNSQGIMGFVEIPCINVKLPIYHGTNSEVLEKGVGHQEGSSLPIGGSSTHAVLTGHTGLNKAKLFTDLLQIRERDLFFIHILGETLAYSVDEISIVLPEDTGKLAIVEGEDHVTLVTCTPYGVNDHRLLVRGTRTEYREAEYQKENEKKSQGSLWMNSYKKALIMGFGILLVLHTVIPVYRSIRNHPEQNRQTKRG